MERNKKLKKNRNRMVTVVIVEIILLIMIFIAGAMINIAERHKKNSPVSTTDAEIVTKDPTEDVSKEIKKEPTQEEILQKEEEEKKNKIEVHKQEVLKNAEVLAAGYDYDAAIAVLKQEEDYETVEEYTAKLTDYEKQKSTLVPLGAYQDPIEVNHIFFHSLIADTSKAFDGDRKENGYNYYMTTIAEFKAMMQQMYDKGYVLVSIHDLVPQEVLTDGSTKFTKSTIMLPPDKKPFVLSQDDVNYYDYMDGDGFASRMVIDEDGKPSTEMILADGSTVTGDYDLVPVLDTFIEEHPDFSYHGARGIIALTGYEGTLGYRTDPASKDSPTYEQDKETVKKVASIMKENGWEFASHGNGHKNMLECSYDTLVRDTDNWVRDVASLVGETDIYIFPYGIDMQSGSGVYNTDKYKYMKKSGFKFFCGVYKDPWIQIKDEYVRMSRRPLDGQAMLMYPERLADLFDLSTIVDHSRPALK